LTYVDEGAANVVYKINLKPSTPPASALDTYGSGTPPPTEVEFDEDPNAVFQCKISRISMMNEF
jgi:inositol-pentakisphosphate 2-kinase